MKPLLVRKLASLAFASHLVFAPTIGLSQTDDAAARRTAVTKVVVKFGPKMAKQLDQSSNFKVPPSKLPEEKRSVAVEKTYGEYLDLKSKYSSAKNSAEWFSLGFEGGTALVAALAGPQASVTIPALIVGSAVATMIDIGNEKLDQVGRIQMRKLLRSRQAEIFEELELDYTSLDDMREDPEELRDAFAKGVDVFRDLRARAGEDSLAWQNTQEMLVDAIANTTKEQWNAIDENQDNIELVADFVVGLADDLAKYQVDVDKRFAVVDLKFASLDQSIEKLNAAVVNLDGRVGSLEKNQRVIADFIFDDMSPKRKVAFLKAGVLDARFACPSGEESCDASELKELMITRFTKEADIQELVSDVNFAVSSLNQIGKITADLGIGSPELNSAIDVANSAVGAFTGFMTGNYLGAISSVSGLFAKKSDPDAERFKILMRYLDQQFTQINRKLVSILESQAKIMDALIALSKQMQKSFERMDQRLASMEFELKRTGDGVRALIWDDWKSCYAVYQKASERDSFSGKYKYLNPATNEFLDSAAPQKVLSTHDISAEPCLVTMQKNMSSIQATERFGNFVDLKWVVDERLSDAAIVSYVTENKSKEVVEVAEDFRGVVQKFEEHQFDPIWQLMLKHTNKAETPSLASQFVVMSRPFITTDEWRFGVDSIVQEPFKCFDGGNSNARHSNVLCSGGGTGDVAAANMLSRPVLADIVVDIADWVLVMAQLADLRVGNDWLEHEEIFELALSDDLPGGPSRGEDLVNQSIPVVDLAIASYAMLYGPDTANLVLDEINEGKDYRALLNGDSGIGGNPFLASNVAMLFLEERFQERHPAEGSRRPLDLNYRLAFERAISDQSQAFLNLEALYGTDLNFALNADGTPTFEIGRDGKKVTLNMPPPGEMRKGRVAWPPRYFELLAVREQLMDRLIGYRIIDGLPEDEREYMAIMLSQ